MGEANSSVTRVWPVLETLLSADPSGASWLPVLLLGGRGAGTGQHFGGGAPGGLLRALARVERPIPGNLARVLGKARCETLGHLRNCFEEELPPPARFLRWMIDHPEELSWPLDKRKGKPARRRRFGKSTQQWREQLLSDDRRLQAEAAAHAVAKVTANNATRSRRAWWAFEGFTSVDCYLETDRLVLLIEGKRTETVSCATDWYPQRNQVVRNLEVAAVAGEARGKAFAVLLCSEEAIMLGDTAFEQSLPHFSPPEREAPRGHYLGCLTWEEIRERLCPALRLPNSLDQAIEICLEARNRRV